MSTTEQTAAYQAANEDRARYVELGVVLASVRKALEKEGPDADAEQALLKAVERLLAVPGPMRAAFLSSFRVVPSPGKVPDDTAAARTWGLEPPQTVVDALLEHGCQQQVALDAIAARAQELHALQQLGIHPVDAAAADALAGLGEPGTPLREWGAKAARDWRDKAGSRLIAHASQLAMPWDIDADWSRWTDPLEWKARLARTLARALWLGEVKAAVEAERAKLRGPPPGIALAIAPHLESFWASGRQLELVSSEKGIALELRGPRGQALASTPTLEADRVEVLQHGIDKLRSYTGHLTLRRFAEEGHRRTRGQVPEPSVLSWEGGLAGVAEWLGASSKQAETEVRDILLAGQTFSHRWPGGEIGGLWTYVLRRAAPGRRAFLEVRLGQPLMPYYGKTLGPREQWVVPVVAMPPRYGREHDWAAQAAFQFAIVRRMVELRLDLVEKGGALLTEPELQRLAKAVGLPLATLRAVIDRWTHDGDDGPACLQVVEPDRYHLPENSTYRAARAFLNGAGERSVRKRAEAQARVRAKAQGKRTPRG